MKYCKKRSWLEYILWLISAAVSGGVIYVIMPVLTAAEHDHILFRQFFSASLIFSFICFIFLLISALSAPRWPGKYSSGTLPECTVLVPAYNEGRHIFDTLNALLASDYPAEKLHITAINDGSQDDTLHWINEAKKRSPLITVIDLKNNQGKKHALYQGMMHSSGDIIVTVDSDSIVRSDTLRQLVQPFADSRTGAVAGSITAKRHDGNPHVRLLDVMLVFGCDFTRRAQSLSGNVFCAPGALSAYRRSAVIPVADEWLKQTFLGQPAQIGEDRAIVTLLLRNGHRVVYQSRARAETCLPQTYSGVCKMLLRWTRSDIRENIIMTPFVLKQLARPGTRQLNLFIHWLMQCLNSLLPLAFLPLGIYALAAAEHINIQLAFFYLFTTLWSIIPAVVYIRRERSLLRSVWAFIFGFYALFGLSWINIYSFFTIGNSSWMTRNLKAADKQMPVEKFQ